MPKPSRSTRPRKRSSSPPKSVAPREVHPHAAGIDVGAEELFVALPPGRTENPVCTFGTFTADLQDLAAYLLKHGITSVAMESTSVFWIPVFQMLETHGLDVCLVNAQHAKNVPGRKTDVSDCQWLQYLHSVGLLNASFRPPDEICAIRTLMRHRADLVGQASTQVQLMQKSLTQMNVRLQVVLSDISGHSGLRIIQAILSGERDPATLSKLTAPRVQASRASIVKALQGDWRQEHLFTLRQARDSYEHTQNQIRACDAEITRLTKALETQCDPDSPLPPDPKRRPNGRRPSPLPPHEEGMRRELYRVLGTDVTQVDGLGVATVLTIVSEVGPNLAAFRSSGAFTNWLGLCPNPQISSGRVLKKGTRPVKCRAATAFRLAAQTLHHQDTMMGNYYRKMRARLGAPKAITAAAHKLARIYYHLVTTRQEYDVSVFAKDEERDRKRRVERLEREAAALGFTMKPIPEPA